MKKLMLLFTLFACVLTSCSKDDDTKNSSNFIKIDSKKNDLKSGTVEDYGLYKDGVYNIDLTLYKDVLSKDSENGGLSIYFSIYSSTPNKLKVGSYQFNNTKAAMTFSYAEIDDNTNNENYSKEIVSGTINVTKSEMDSYELTFDCVDANGKKITGQYNGQVYYFSNDGGV